MLADPKLAPFTFGASKGVVAPAGMRMLAGVIVTFDGSLLVRARNTPPAGAGTPRAIGNGAETPGATLILAGKMIPLRFVSWKDADRARPAAAALTV